MKLCRFRDPDNRAQSRCGVVDLERGVVDCIDHDYPLDQVELLAPVDPGKIVCVGLNYRSHQLDGHRLPAQPLIFLKPASAAACHNAEIRYPEQASQVDFEGELALVIGQRADWISPDQADDYILGYCCANDVTARNIQQLEGEHTRAKGFRDFAPFGPWVETDFDPATFELNTYLNGELKQSTDSSDLLFSIPELVSRISEVMTLEPGDLVLTGTPRGMGPMQPGDEVTVEISGIGRLSNRLGQPQMRQPQVHQPQASQPQANQQEALRYV